MLTKIVQSILVASAFMIPVIGHFAINNDTIFQNENRNAFAYPQDYHDKYWDELQKAHNDRLVGRETFQVLTSTYLSNICSQTTDFSYKDAFAFKGNSMGWFYLGDEGRKYYQQHILPVKQKDIFYEKNLSLLKHLELIAPNNTYMVVGPDKASVYPEFMNQHIGYPGKYRHFENIKADLEKAGVKVIDNQEAIVKEKDLTYEKSLYFANDSHWNKKGALFAFNNTIKELLGDEFTPLTYDFTWKKLMVGDLNKSQYISELKQILDLCEPVSKENSEVTSIDLEDNTQETGIRQFGSDDFIRCNVNSGTCNYEKIINSRSRKDLKVALISDSFGGFFEPYLVDYFIDVLWCNDYEDHTKILKYVSEFQPDIILYLRIERSI